MTAFDPAALRALPFDLPATAGADDNDRFVETPSAGPAAPPPVPEETLSEDDSGVTCVFAGPSGVGKTKLLMALHRACALVPPNEPHLRFVANTETAALIQNAVNQMVDPNASHAATAGIYEYRFQISTVPHVGRVRVPIGFRVHDFEISDGPGGALFPNEALPAHATPEEHTRWRAELFEKVREARALVLCVNADEPLHQIWESNIADFIANSTVPRPVRRSWLSRSVSRLVGADTGVTEQPLEQLNADTVLLLLTKVDRLCSRLAATFRERRIVEDQAAERVARLTPRDLASMLDPIWTAREVLGLQTMVTLRHAFRGRNLAVGVCSAGGFTIDGSAYWKRDGLPQRNHDDTPDEVLKRWRPFGVRDAIRFLTLRQAHGRVRIIRDQDLEDDGRQPVLLASCSAEPLRERS